MLQAHETTHFLQIVNNAKSSLSQLILFFVQSYFIIQFKYSMLDHASYLHPHRTPQG